MENIAGVPVWGSPVDEGAFLQIANCSQGAAHVALMADHHKGYAVPIGGVVAYENKISPSGIGFDIACLAAGTLVTTADGYAVPIEGIGVGQRLDCWDGARVRPISGHGGHIANGGKPVLRLRLVNGRTLVVTADHRVLTANGWRAAADLTPEDRVACPIFQGLAYEEPRFHGVALPDFAQEIVAAALLDFADPARLAALVRLLGCVSGDGHVSADGGNVGIYTTDEDDAAAMAADFERLGYAPRLYRRQRKAGYKTEILVRVGSRSLNALFVLLGSPGGRKAWEPEPMPWLFTMPAWVRAQFVSGFFSAECMTPRPQRGYVPNLQVKQSGENDNALRFIGRLLNSLCFEVSIAPSGPERGVRRDYILQLLGGAREQVRFFETVGFCYARQKRQRAAQVASLVWQWAHHREAREAARAEARRLHAGGMHWKEVIQRVQEAHDVSRGFVHHAIYADRGPLRPERGKVFAPDVTDEICWVPAHSLEDAGDAAVYDIATADEAHCFLAGGMVVHNCGNKAVRLDIPARTVRSKIKKIMDDIWSHLSFGVGRNNKQEVDHELFDDETWKMHPVKPLKQMARNQLGTIGSGNHYVDVFADELDRVWVGVHFGSRGLGHKTATFFLEAGGASDGMDADPLVLDVRSSLGGDYLACMELAGRYAYAGRDWVCAEVARLLGAKIVEEVHNHHNYAWKETHGGRDLWVVRKGATPAFPGQRGFVGGSMGDQSVILEGVASDESADSLCSTVHGAGRVMSRTAARGKTNRKTGEVIAPGAVSREMMQDWIRDKGVELRGAGVDESPHCYKRLPDVLAHHAASIRVLHTLTPLGVAMAGPDIVDPYKD